MNLNQYLRSKQGQRALALVVLVIPFLLLYLLIVGPYLRLLEEKGDQIDELSFQLQRLKRTAGQEPHWRKLLKSYRETQGQDQQYLEGTTPALASADLQKHLGEIIKEAGGQVTSTQVLTTKPEGAFTKVAVRIRFSATTPSLREILHGIESSQPLLLIEQLSIRATRGRRRSPRSKRTLPVDKLNVDMQVVGYMATPAS